MTGSMPAAYVKHLLFGVVPGLLPKPLPAPKKHAAWHFLHGSMAKP
jgi:hypothetical protein